MKEFFSRSGKVGQAALTLRTFATIATPLRHGSVYNLVADTSEELQALQTRAAASGDYIVLTNSGDDRFGTLFDRQRRPISQEEADRFVAMATAAPQPGH